MNEIQNKKIDSELKDLDKIVQTLSELGVFYIDSALCDSTILEFHMDHVDFKNMPFYEIEKVEISDFLQGKYKLSIKHFGFKFFCIVETKELNRHFPEKIIKKENFIEIDGEKFVKVED